MHGSLPELQRSGAAFDFILGNDDGGPLTVPDAHLLFHGELKRAGDSLKIVGEDGKSALVQDYFKSARLPDLLSPDGAVLSGDVVAAVAGSQAPGQYAQAGAPAAAAAEIGRVAIAQGNATAVRNGVTISLNVGDVILKGDVVQTGGGNSALGITFNDGSAFNLTANAQMVISEYLYDAGSSNNAALFNIVRGTLSFVASQVAKTGDMQIVTPTTTMGIRGTTGVIEVTLSDGVTKAYLYPDRDGNVGRIEFKNSATGVLQGELTVAGTAVSIASVSGVAVLEQLLVTAQDLSRHNALVGAVQGISSQATTPGPGPGPGTDKQASNSSGSSTPFSYEVKFSPPTTDKSGVTTQEVTVTTKTETTPPPTVTENKLPPPPPVVDDFSSPPPAPTFNIITGTDNGDTIFGSPITDIVAAGGGDDTVFGLGGDDTINGGGGNDILIGGTATTTFGAILATTRSSPGTARATTTTRAVRASTRSSTPARRSAFPSTWRKARRWASRSARTRSAASRT